VDGVQCVFFDPAAGGSGDLVFDTAFWANPNTPPRRWLNYQFVSSANGEVMNCTPPSVGGVVPASGLYKAHMVVGKIYALAPGAGALNPARFRVTDTTTLRFSDRLGPNGDCSTTVWVSRSADGKTWTIEGRLTDVAAIYQDVNGATVPTSYWHMPFRITVRLK
jgi:hypothetical protein